MEMLGRGLKAPVGVGESWSGDSALWVMIEEAYQEF